MTLKVAPKTLFALGGQFRAMQLSQFPAQGRPIPVRAAWSYFLFFAVKPHEQFFSSFPWRALSPDLHDKFKGIDVLLYRHVYPLAAGVNLRAL
jgi:hypothetical protein